MYDLPETGAYIRCSLLLLTVISACWSVRFLEFAPSMQKCSAQIPKASKPEAQLLALGACICTSSICCMGICLPTYSTTDMGFMCMFLLI